MKLRRFDTLFEESQVEYFIGKFRDKMQGTTPGSSAWWVDGATELSDDEKRKVWKGIQKYIDRKDPDPTELPKWVLGNKGDWKSIGSSDDVPKGWREMAVIGVPKGRKIIVKESVSEDKSKDDAPTYQKAIDPILFWNAFQLIFDGTQGYYSENGDGDPYWTFSEKEFGEIEEEMSKIKTMNDVEKNRARIQELGEKVLDGAEGYLSEHGDVKRYWDRKAFPQARKYFSKKVSETNTYKSTKYAILLDDLRDAAKRIKNADFDDLVIPEWEEHKDKEFSANNKYLLGIKPGNYSPEQVSRAVQFIADMME